MTEGEMDDLFHALAHEHRRRMLDVLKARPGLGVGELAAEFDVSRIAVMQHLSVLERAHLIVSQQDGRTRRLYLNAMPIQLIYDRWTTEFSAHWGRRVADIKALAEAAARGAQKAKPKPKTKRGGHGQR